MARINTEEINRNRKVVEESTQDTPWNAAIADSDSDYGQALYDNLPEDRVGFMTNGRKVK